MKTHDITISVEIIRQGSFMLLKSLLKLLENRRLYVINESINHFGLCWLPFLFLRRSLTHSNFLFCLTFRYSEKTLNLP